jgi:FMN phosphatase YigB (HAD superfamily)
MQGTNHRQPVVSPLTTALPQGHLADVRALLIDIDNTIIRARANASEGPNPFSSGCLREVVRVAGVGMGGLTPEETERRMRKVQTEIRWWHWSDFIVELGLDPKGFWEFAYETEKRYLEATGPEIGAALKRLREAGFLLYVASNNPSSGILHKLRVAGLGHVHGCGLFSQLLGATELQAMKWEPKYWKKALAHIGLGTADVAVVGDELECDWLVPKSIGIRCAFQIDRTQDLSGEDGDGLYHVQTFDQIADRLIGARSDASGSGEGNR